jgi:hypothetical protein
VGYWFCEERLKRSESVAVGVRGFTGETKYEFRRLNPGFHPLNKYFCKPIGEIKMEDLILFFFSGAPEGRAYMLRGAGSAKNALSEAKA